MRSYSNYKNPNSFDNTDQNPLLLSCCRCDRIESLEPFDNPLLLLMTLLLLTSLPAAAMAVLLLLGLRLLVSTGNTKGLEGRVGGDSDCNGINWGTEVGNRLVEGTAVPVLPRGKGRSLGCLMILVSSLELTVKSFIVVAVVVILSLQASKLFFSMFI